MSFLRLPVLLSVVTGSILSMAQQPATAPPAMQQPATSTAQTVVVDENFIHRQFGEEFSLTPVSTPFMRDIDGDGVEDVVIIARSRKPMLDAAEHNYKVVDPYYDFYGYGDPKLTSTFGSEELMEKNLVILVIHGAGPQAWRSDTPRAKFVIINVPFKKITVRKLQLRKRQVNGIFAEEANSSAGDSVIFWDGKQYKYQPLGTGTSDD